ncbi:cystathionine beta-lyase [Photobacterium damselae subsp. piscicida]|uniref:Cystathionine beta-lyase n=1 Tax=Photobacterium damsela subsp. piscicida TaxID=38294 RepID=A0A1Q9GUZ3_PHODP|nr:cystathionine beta-lyase [Photobacterium damselae]MBE8126837.1 cystathionine beta-lyase [Photobacterium damselae subsp. piscicida]MDP2543172.1 cystathionine beta-lyase [Photobacterium damselae subsp. piscicida]OLQ78987.1 cystathionine beta-lyase [Photobacterium damselae subsp. piscicida]PSV71136.1 cystathionine beta-lyase [Photobacterium damselae]PSW77265.1 cystathionine beta-lyase [Photobacterium damselae]
MAENKGLHTKIITAGRAKKWTQHLVNTPVSRASTIVFDSVKEMKEATANRGNKSLYYGRRGTNTHFAFQEAMTELEGGVGCALFPCGAAAITNSVLAFVKAGDHILMVDGVYEPTRDFCDKVLARMGVETTYYDPLIGDELRELIRPNTSVLFLESPCSITMEVQDVPKLASIAHEHDIVVMLDNTWASPIHFQPFDHGVDISIQAATKYIVGHSDVMLGTATANERCWSQLQEQSYLMGQCTSADDIYLAARGLRTLGVRMKQHEESALKVAHWLSQRPEVDHVRHPAFESCDGNAFFERDYLGSNGLFSFVLKYGDISSVNAMLDSMKHFSMGYSWGGYESLILANHNINNIRTVDKKEFSGSIIRLHIGLESVEDLISDLNNGFEVLNKKYKQQNIS